MFKIDNNMTIKISQGDDSNFPLFLNRGTVATPIRYKFAAGDGNEVYFYIFNLNDKYLDNPLVYKKFHTPALDSTKGIIETYYEGMKQPNTEFDGIINENQDLLLSLAANDTKYLMPGQYKYQIKAHLKDKESVYYNYTVTNKHDFFILNDDYSDRIWE